jgi:hypothetical protein
MSIVTKKATGGVYVYFQTYQDGKRVDEYIGPASERASWAEAYLKLLDYQEKERKRQLAVVQEKIGEQLNLTRRRRPESTEKLSAEKREKLAEDVETLTSQPLAVAYSPLLKDELEKLLEDLRAREKKTQRS